MTNPAPTSPQPAPGSSTVEFGLDSFGDLPTGPDGTLLSYAAAIRQVVTEAIAADQRGVDVIALGEHHRDDFAISSPETVLAGIATRTERIRLASGVTVLSSDDPVRVFERFATVDALSNGRAQVILGRGSFTESFPLFGYDLADYDELFEEKVQLFAELLKEEPVTWEGRTRASLRDADVFPKTESGRIDTLVGVGGSPESVVRAAHYGFALMLAIIGGPPQRFAPYVDLYRRAAKEFGTDPREIGIHSPGHVAETDTEALDTYWPAFKVHRDRIGRDRGWPPITREEFDGEVARGSLYVGSPETVARKIAATVTALGVDRFDLVYGFGPLPADARLSCVELYGERVIPLARQLLGRA